MKKLNIDAWFTINGCSNKYMLKCNGDFLVKFSDNLEVKLSGASVSELITLLDTVGYTD